MRLFPLVLLTVLSLSSYASEWNIYFENEEVKILFQYSDCHDKVNGIHQQKVLLRFINKTDKKVEVSFGRDLTYSGSTNSLMGDMDLFKVVLNPSEDKQGTCTDKNDTLHIFSKQLNIAGRELKKFELKSVSVKTIE